MLHKLKEINHFPIVVAGCLLWLPSFLLELMLIYPYSLIGIWTSISLALFGSIIWFLKRKEIESTSHDYEVFSDDNIEVSLDVPFGNLGLFYTSIFLFWMCLVVGCGSFLDSSEAAVYSKKYLESDSVILQRTEGIIAYSTLKVGSITNDSANLQYGLIAKNGHNFRVTIDLIKQNNQWEIIKTSYK
jgi:hypothetical protein